MTTTITSPTQLNSPNMPPPETRADRWRAKLAAKSRLYLAMWLLVLPTTIGMLVFNYYPKVGTIWYSFFNWDGQMTEEFIGLKNFVDAFTRDALFWQTFQLVFILLVANLFKMWPSILTAIVLHRIRSQRAQYFYRVLFVLPMVIPGLVWLLLWKSFYDSTTGLLNAFLNLTGLMHVLRWLDHAMPTIASKLLPFQNAAIEPVFGSVWGLAWVGVLLLSLHKGAVSVPKNWMWWTMVMTAGLVVWWPSPDESMHMLLGAVITPVVLIIVSEFARRTERGIDYMDYAAYALISVCMFLVLFANIWTAPTLAFNSGSPAWLGNTKLVIPSIIFWGFPWVGTVGVLIYLAGLQGISEDVYEAGELDGLSSFGRMIHIELPLIMTQVRINLIFLTIGTLTDYGLFLLLLGPEGGPGSVGMPPGLYMYRAGFIDMRLGYSCALGMVMFAIVMFITVFYNRYVKVDK